ncbi:hypothetical protein [Streptomyces sp. NPDC047976]|uniref:hypothetical protein n=1 Tax=Streptomyces sp. NPDC047976 TaxID=3155746 RepID=UPI003438CB61
MNERQSRAPAGVVGELIEAWLAFDHRLSSGSGFDEEGYGRLRAALRACAQAWSADDVIPRAGASVLVDVFPATEANASLYAGETADRVMNAAYALHELVGDCVVPRRPHHAAPDAGQA